MAHATRCVGPVSTESPTPAMPSTQSDNNRKRVREALFGERGRKVLVFLLCLLLSAGFWVVTALRDTFEVELRLPIELTDVPEAVHITTPLPENVIVSVRDKGTTLVSYFGRRSLRPLSFRFEDYDNGAVSGRGQIPLSTVRTAVLHQLDATTTIQSLRPDTLEFYYNRGLHYRLPVCPLGTIATSSNNYLQEVTVEPDSVDVYAPSHILDTMRCAYTQALTLTELTKTTTQPTRLMPLRGVKYEPAEVEVTAHVDYYAEKSVKVPIIGTNFPPNRRLRTFPSQATVTFRVGSARLREVTSENFVLAFTYEELLHNEPDKLTLHLKSQPEGVANVRIAPQEVDYLIEQTAEEDGSQE